MPAPRRFSASFGYSFTGRLILDLKRGRIIHKEYSPVFSKQVFTLAEAERVILTKAKDGGWKAKLILAGRNVDLISSIDESRSAGGRSGMQRLELAPDSKPLGRATFGYNFLRKKKPGTLMCCYM